MITKEFLIDSIYFADMVTTKELNLGDTNTVPFRGDANGLFKTKGGVEDNRFHPILLQVNDIKAASEYVDKESLLLIDNISDRTKDRFVNFLSLQYK